MPCLRTAGRFVKRPPHCGTALRHWEHTRSLEGLLRLGEQALQSADAMEDGQQLHIEKLDDIVLALEQMKEQL